MRLGCALWAGLLVACGGDDATTDGPPEPVDTGTAPVGPAPYGPPNAWPHVMDDEIPGNLVGTGYSDGFLAYDFQAPDQNGDLVSLYQFYGRVVLLDFMAIDCVGCSDRMKGHEDWWETVTTDQIMMVVVLRPGADGAAPTQQDAKDWAAFHFATFPVLADTELALDAYVPVPVPNAWLVDWDMRIIESVFEPVDTNQVLVLSQDAPGN